MKSELAKQAERLFPFTDYTNHLTVDRNRKYWQRAVQVLRNETARGWVHDNKVGRQNDAKTDKATPN